MKIYNNLSEFKIDKATVLTTGTFDGIHIGHQEILKRLVEGAKSIGGESVLFTFHPHPRMVIHPDDHGLKLLSTPEEKAEILEEIGIDHLIIHPFSVEFSKISARDYVRNILVNQIGIKKMIIGYDHRFGNRREGDYDQLKEFGDVYGFDLDKISALELEEIKVSSTKIRKALAEGNLQVATKYLGRNYTLSGKVVEGKKLGSKIGFPTANIQVNYKWKLIPANGVYCVSCKFDENKFDGLLNIGSRPTVNQDSEDVSVEVHLLNWNGLIYDKNMTIEFLYKIRDEKKFESLEDLKLQIERDKQLVLNR